MRVAHQLIAVAIAGDNDDVVATLFAHQRNGADNVVGLEAHEVDGGDIECNQYLAHQPHLLAQNVRGCFALCFVLRVRVVPKRWFGPVKCHQHAVGFVFFDEVDEHRHKAKDGVRDLPTGRCHVGG